MLLTVMFTAADVVRLPALSLATAVSVWLPLAVAAVFQAMEYGDVGSAEPRLTPSSLNWTLTTPTLSLALAVTLTVPDTAAPAAGDVMAAAGGVGSGAGIA